MSDHTVVVKLRQAVLELASTSSEGLTISAICAAAGVSRTDFHSAAANPIQLLGEALSDELLSQLAQAHDDFEAGRHDLAMENAYRAALRIAGARSAQSPVVRKRKRLPTNAWDKLALTGAAGADWAAERKKTVSASRKAKLTKRMGDMVTCGGWIVVRHHAGPA